MSEKYSFYMFENFELTKDCFIKELHIVKLLQLSRKTLRYKRNKLNHSMYKHYDSQSVLIYNAQQHHDRNVKKLLLFTFSSLYKGYQLEQISIRNNFHSLHPKAKDNSHLLLGFEGVYKRSTLDILNDALKGLVMLQETYEQDINDFSKGHLYLKNVIERTSRKTDSLQPDDLAAMSSIAFDYYNWYDNSLKYLKESLTSYHLLSSKKRSVMLKDDLEMYLLKMKKQYSSYHNKLHSKKKNIIGIDWKLYPYQVDKGL